MIEFMAEDELLAEFHRAGIFTDEEKAALRNEHERQDNFQQWAMQMQGYGDSHLAMMQRSALQNVAFANQTAELINQRAHGLGLGNLLGGGFTWLFGVR